MKPSIALPMVLLAGAVVAGCLSTATSASLPSTGNAASAVAKVGTDPGGVLESMTLKPKPGDQLAAFSMGCFWNSEHVFRAVKGVVATAVGYTGGTVDDPTYEMVCTHTTGHAETVLVEFDPKVVTYKQLLNDFWINHDPTTVDREGPDEGTNYRSAIWTFSPEQMKEALASKKEDQAKERAPIITQISPIGKFWKAETYHQQYDEKNHVVSCPNPRNYPGL